MSTAEIQLSPSFFTFADAIASVGQVDPQRIRAYPPPGMATEKDVLQVLARDKRLCELIDGVLVEKTMGAYESMLAIRIAYFLEDFVAEHDLGVVLGEAGMLRLWPERVRIPDVCFIAWNPQLPDKAFPRQPIPALHPDLAVEVLSDSNTAAEMHRKLHDYFAAGTRLVWYLDPDTQIMSVYTSPTAMKPIGIDGTLDGGDLLPGFRLPMADIFRVRRPDA